MCGRATHIQPLFGKATHLPGSLRELTSDEPDPGVCTAYRVVVAGAQIRLDGPTVLDPCGIAPKGRCSVSLRFCLLLRCAAKKAANAGRA